MAACSVDDQSKLILDPLIREIAIRENYRTCNYELRYLQNEGDNFTTKLYLIVLKEDLIPDLYLFSKIANFSEYFRGIFGVRELFSREIFTLRDLAREVNLLEERYRVPEAERYRFPRYYASSIEHGKETVVMENLRPLKYEIYNRKKSMDWSYAAAAVTAIAKFHALSMVLHHDRPQFYSEHIATKGEMFTKNYSSREGGVTYYEQMFGVALEASAPRHKERLARWIEKNSGTNMLSNYFKPLRISVLAHGDYRISNILVKYEGNVVTSAVPIDYQTLYHGSTVNDLLYLIFTGTDGKFREKYYQKTIDFYYQKLSDTLQVYGRDIKEVYPRDDFDLDYKDRLEYGLFLSIFLLPIITVDTEKIPDLGSVKSSIILPENNPVNELYIKRLDEILDDFTNWGYL